MNEFDDVKVTIGDQEVDADITGVEIENQFPEARSPGEKPERVSKNFKFSVEIEDISEELENWILYGDPEGPESIEAYNLGRFDAGEVQEVSFERGILENIVRDIIRDELPDSLTEGTDKTPLADVEEHEVIDRIEDFQERKGGDPTTGEVADLIGEPRDETKALLQDMEARDMVESYPIGRTDNWRLPGGEE